MTRRKGEMRAHNSPHLPPECCCNCKAYLRQVLYCWEGYFPPPCTVATQHIIRHVEHIDCYAGGINLTSMSVKEAKSKDSEASQEPILVRLL